MCRSGISNTDRRIVIDYGFSTGVLANCQLKDFDLTGLSDFDKDIIYTRMNEIYLYNSTFMEHSVYSVIIERLLYDIDLLQIFTKVPYSKRPCVVKVSEPLNGKHRVYRFKLV